MNNESFFKSAQLLLDLMSKKRQREINRGEYYNVFEVLNLSTDEVRLHSSFIADLLNPKGKHGLGTEPLKSYMQILDSNLNFDEEDLINCNVKREYVIGPISQDQTSGGNIDILLTIGNYQVIIENKIYAGDQPKQLLRYHNFAKSHPHKLVYLTLGGNKPSGSSTDCLACGEGYTCISYRKDIAVWIGKCLIMAVSKPLIRETLQQYLYIIKTLTDTIMEEDDKSELFALMDKYPDVVLAIRKEDWYYRKHLVSTYVIEPFKRWCAQQQYNCLIGHEFLNQDSGVWFGISHSGWKKCIAVKFENQDFKKAYYGIGELDINDQDTIVIPEKIAFDKYQSWTVDIAKDLISYNVFNYVRDKFDQLMKEINTGSENHL